MHLFQKLFGRQAIQQRQTSQRHGIKPSVEVLEDRLTPTAGVREQYLLELINDMRQNPQAELQRYLNANDADVNQNLSFFNVNLTQLTQEFAALSAVAPLAWNDTI